MVNTFKNKKRLIGSLVTAVLWLIPFFVVGFLCNKIENDILANLIKTIVRVIASAGIMVYVNRKYEMEIGIRTKNLFKGIFWYGIVVFIFCLLMPLLSYREPEISFIEALPVLLFYFCVYMMVGTFEEVLCRGLLFNSFKAYWGDNKKSVYLSAFISALLFGCLHLFNLNGSNTISTITQVIYATFFGMLFATIYYRSGNLLSCIILHGLVDFAGSIWTCFLRNRAAQMAIDDTTDSTVSDAIVVLIITIPFLISSLVQLRKEFKMRAAMNAGTVANVGAAPQYSEQQGQI